MKLQFRLVVALLIAAVCSTAAAAVLGPVSAPPGGVSVSSTCQDGVTPCDFNAGITIGFGGFDFTNVRDIYWQPAVTESPAPLAYSASASNLAGGVVVLQSTSPYVTRGYIPFQCSPSNSSFDIEAVFTATSGGQPVPFVSAASVGLTGTPVVVAPGPFVVNVVFKSRSSGGGSFGALNNINLDHCGGSEPYWSDGINASVFYYDNLMPPAIGKAFAPTAVHLNQNSTVTYSLTNPDPLTVISGVTFTDNLPAGLTVAATPNLTNTCHGAVNLTANSVSLVNGTLFTNGSCSVSLAVTAIATGHQSSSTVVSSTNGGTGNTATAGLDVLVPPSITKSFSPPRVNIGGTSTVMFAISNANPIPVDGSFTDSLPSGLVVASPPAASNTCGGSLTANAGGSSITFSAAALPMTPCSIGVNVTSASDAIYPNQVTLVSSAAGTGPPSSASLTVANPPMILNSFGIPSMPPGSSTLLTFTIADPNPNLAFTGVAFTTGLPSGLVVASSPNVTSDCGGAVTAVAGSSSITLANGVVAAGAQCSVSVSVTATSLGLKNDSVTVSSTEGGTGNTSMASITIGCSYSLTSSGTNAPTAGMGGTFNVFTTGGCSWTALSDAAWLTSTSAATGSGTVSYNVASSAFTTPRVGHLTIGDQTFTVTQSGVQPANLVATATSQTSISVTWSSDPVDHFEVWRDDATGGHLVGQPTTASFTDSTVTANGAYLYFVRAVDSTATASSWSAPDVATTFVFTDDPLSPGATPVKAVHINELRSAINALMVVDGLSPFFGGGVSSGDTITAAQIIELQNVLDSVQADIGLPRLTHTPITAGDTVISATDIQQLRNALK